MTTIFAPKVKLANGYEIPIVGLGTWKSGGNLGKQAVKDAIYAGYRHLDCAYMYMNEGEVGAAIKELCAEGIIKREDLFITTKLWNAHHSDAKVAEGFQSSLDSLGLTYIDLYLIHWPMGFQEGGENMPKDESGNMIMSDVDYVETWKAMEKLVTRGLVRSIGMSNFNSSQLQRVLDIAEIRPSVLQVECHPYFNQEKLFQFCKSHDIVLTAYSPLGAPNRVWAKPEDPSPLKDQTVTAIAAKYGKSPQQICIRFQIQRGIVAIPKSVTKSRIEENFQVFDFTLSDEDMINIYGIGDKNYRAICAEWMAHSKYYPFNAPF